jgi:uncharacterized membrane protein
MNGYPRLFGPMTRHGYALGYHDQGTTWVEWAIFAMTIAILVIVALLLFDAYVSRRRRRLFWGEHGGDKPLAILHMRYARGEIDHDAFSQALADLGSPQEQATAEPEKEASSQPRRRRGRS